ncbi:MAG: hypothetical protein H6581_23265 [Bacteroidia bacterium]|nr:hypothetical protein [Bacteroidia bacterium]
MKSLKIILWLLFCICMQNGASFAQSSVRPGKSWEILPNKGSMYVHWGYNRSIYSRSDIHVSGPDYDFTVYDVRATDRPSPFKPAVYLNPGLFTIPQFNIRAGYFLSERWSVSLGYDHMKYVMVNDVPAVFSGVIGASASPKYEGSYLKDTVNLAADLLRFEHTDGLNVITADVEYSYPLVSFWKNRFKIQAQVGAGGIFVVPRSDVRVFGKGLNNDYHIAGYTFTGKSGLRLDFLRRMYFLGEMRGGYVALPWVLVANDSPELGDHQFAFLEWYVVCGIRFHL